LIATMAFSGSCSGALAASGATSPFTGHAGPWFSAMASLKMFSELPEQHDGYVDVFPRCKVYGRIKSKPTGGLPCHLFCRQERKKPVALEIAA
jgi:hypothetical protein